MVRQYRADKCVKAKPAAKGQKNTAGLGSGHYEATRGYFTWKQYQGQIQTMAVRDLPGRG